MENDYFDLITSPVRIDANSTIPSFDSTSWECFNWALDSAPDGDPLTEEQRTVLRDSRQLAELNEESLSELAKSLLLDEQKHYMRLAEVLHFFHERVRQSAPGNLKEEFTRRVDAEFGLKYRAAMQRVQIYRNVYQRLHDELTELPHKLEAVRTLRGLGRDVLLPLAEEKNRDSWEFTEGRIILRNCIGAGKAVNIDTSRTALIGDLYKVEQDPIEFPDEDIPPREGTHVRLLECGVPVQRHFYIRRNDGIVTHYQLLNSNLTLLQGDEPTIEPDESALLSCYLRYNEHPDGILTSERNRECFVYDRHHAGWVSQNMEDVTL